MNLSKKNTMEVVNVAIENDCLKEPVILSMTMLDKRKLPSDSLKLLLPKLTLNYRSMSIPLTAIVNIQNKKRIDIQLLDDEFIDEDDFDLTEELKSNDLDIQVEDEFSLSFKDAFLGECFLANEWRSLYTLILLNNTEEQAATICSEIFLEIQRYANKWLKTLDNS